MTKPEETCNCCGEEVRRLPPDGISYCDFCEVVVEGQTTKTNDKEGK